MNWYVQIIRIPKLSDPELFDECPYMPCREPVQSDTRPGLDYWGPYHCAGCAISQASFGATERQALTRNHVTLSSVGDNGEWMPVVCDSPTAILPPSRAETAPTQAFDARRNEK